MAKKEEKKELYIFIHPKKFFRIGVLEVQFVNGRFETEDRELAEKVINYDGVECISNP